MESEHAQLPLWKDKSVTEKIEILRKMVDDLYVYALMEPRQRLVRILDEHVPSDEKEHSDVKKIKEAVLGTPNIFSKNCEFGHLVASALIIDLTSGRYLLHHHDALGIILQFGGHAEYEIDLSDVAMREAREETGLADLFFFPSENNPRPLDIDMHHIPSFRNRPDHYHLDFRYLLATKSPNDLLLKSDANKFLWLRYEDVEEHRYPLQMQLVRLINKANQLYSKHNLRPIV